LRWHRCLVAHYCRMGSDQKLNSIRASAYLENRYAKTRAQCMPGWRPVGGANLDSPARATDTQNRHIELGIRA
jgi:hypothetical protein